MENGLFSLGHCDPFLEEAGEELMKINPCCERFKGVFITDLFSLYHFRNKTSITEDFTQRHFINLK